MDSGEDVYEPQEEGVLSRERHGQNAQSFFIFLGSVLTIILLGFFLELQLDTFTRILILLGLLALAGVGFILLEKRHKVEHDEITTEEVPVGNIEQTVETETTETPEVPVKTELTPFEQLVREALDSIPEEFHEQMENVVVMVEHEPDEETLKEVGTAEGQTLLGLYHGVPLTAWGHNYALLPERITIYQDTIERYCDGDPERIRNQVRATVLHEVAHHFGMDHDDMPIWVK